MKRTRNLFFRRNAVKVLMMVYDALAVNIAYFLALVLRYYVTYETYEFNPDAVEFLDTFLKFAPFYGVICVAVFYCFRLYNTSG